jgi:ATP-dependent Lon protease
MFKIALTEIAKKFNIPYRTVQNFKEREDYRKDIVEIFADLKILEDLAKEDLANFTDAELADIKEAIDNYLTDVILNKREDLNSALLKLIKDNILLKKITEKEVLDDFLDPKPILYKIDKYLDKLSRYFLVKERLKNIEEYLKLE